MWCACLIKATLLSSSELHADGPRAFVLVGSCLVLGIIDKLESVIRD